MHINSYKSTKTLQSRLQMRRMNSRILQIPRLPSFTRQSQHLDTHLPATKSYALSRSLFSNTSILEGQWCHGGAPASPLASPQASCDAAWSGTQLANVLPGRHTHGSAALPLPTSSCCGHVCSTESTLSHALLLPKLTSSLLPALPTQHCPILPGPCLAVAIWGHT